ncbi:MAG: STAS domain-containing protein [Candidatus Kapabacteria bacterium]|nr:STAS domain-containing protein [Candidatus Kapabacteria bacterium]MCX7937435.1 STAS domain-containing protein [Chlorobiota bacterium]
MEVHRYGTTAVIQLSAQLVGGEQSVALADSIRNLLSTGVEHIVFDCQAVELVNSTGLGMLVSGLATLRSHGGRCTLAAVPPAMDALLRLTRLDSVFALAPTVNDALLR